MESAGHNVEPRSRTEQAGRLRVNVDSGRVEISWLRPMRSIRVICFATIFLFLPHMFGFGAWQEWTRPVAGLRQPTFPSMDWVFSSFGMRHVLLFMSIALAPAGTAFGVMLLCLKPPLILEGQEITISRMIGGRAVGSRTYDLNDIEVILAVEHQGTSPLPNPLIPRRFRSMVSMRKKDRELIDIDWLKSGEPTLIVGTIADFAKSHGVSHLQTHVREL